LLNSDAARRARVLIAEDDDSLRRLLEIRLSANGFELRCADDGVRALELMQDWVPDVVVCDVMMPRLSGLSVVREMRERGDTADVPVLLLTARCFDEDIQEVMHLGGVTYMPKPFDFKQLGEKVDALLRSHPFHMKGTAS
jgi:DNA-binding response OmpR family regulator